MHAKKNPSLLLKDVYSRLFGDDKFFTIKVSFESRFWFSVENIVNQISKCDFYLKEGSRPEGKKFNRDTSGNRSLNIQPHPSCYILSVIMALRSVGSTSPRSYLGTWYQDNNAPPCQVSLKIQYHTLHTKWQNNCNGCGKNKCNSGLVNTANVSSAIDKHAEKLAMSWMRQ